MPNNECIKPQMLVFALIIGVTMYTIFGILDYYLMPSNYQEAWIVRFLLMAPVIGFTLYIYFNKPNFRYNKFMIFSILSLGQLGIIIIIGISNPEDIAHSTYYAGLILVILWASFIFSISYKITVYFAIFTIIIYNLFAFFVQGFISLNVGSYEFSVLVSNNAFLISSAFLAIIGAYRLEKKTKENNRINEELIIEKQLLELSKERAEESDRLKSAFLANMSHEIRTPMNGMLGFSKLLNDKSLSADTQEKYIGIIEKSGDRLLNIINDIINISKIESGLMELIQQETNLNHQIDYISSFFKPEIEEKEMNFVCINSLPFRKAIIITDKEKLIAILMNLFKNAIKYSNIGTIELGISANENNIEFYVKDMGIGIQKERLDAIFERFVQADIEDKNAYQGAGLGLSISKAYVEMLGGKIWVKSELGKGSTFFFTLPINNKTASDSIDKLDVLSKNELKESQAKYNILIVEDDAISEDLITITIAKLAKNILVARTGNEAIEACRKHPDIDLVLMDLQMPILDGYEATRQIRKFNKDVVIIAQTAFALEGDKEKSISAGCNDYISKPIDKTLLVQMINNHLGK